MQTYVLLAGLEQLGHHALRKPNTLTHKPAFDAGFAVFGLVEQEFPAGGSFGRKIVVGHGFVS